MISAQAFGIKIHREEYGKERLGLQNDRDEARRDVSVHRHEAEAELPATDGDAVGGEVDPRHRRAFEEKRHGQETDEKAHKDEE